MISMFVFVMDHSLRVVVIAIVIFTYISIVLVTCVNMLAASLLMKPFTHFDGGVTVMTVVGYLFFTSV